MSIWKKLFKQRWYLLFTIPGVVYIIVLIAYPIIYNVVMSFQEVTAATLLSDQRPFIGLNNYKAIFADPKFVLSIRNTIWFTVVCIVFQFAIGFALALLFSQDFPLNRLYRGIIMIGWMVPMMVVAALGKWFFTGDRASMVNFLLLRLGLISDPVKWLVNSRSAMIALAIVNIWKGIPFNMLLMSTALSTMPEELYEAASIDGAGAGQRFWYITVPMLKPTILAVITQGFILTFKVFDLIVCMTSGGPADTTQLMATYSYKLTFDQFQFGLGAAGANVMFLLLLVVSLVYIRFISKDEVIS